MRNIRIQLILRRFLLYTLKENQIQQGWTDPQVYPALVCSFCPYRACWWCVLQTALHCRIRIAPSVPKGYRGVHLFVLVQSFLFIWNCKQFFLTRGVWFFLKITNRSLDPFLDGDSLQTSPVERKYLSWFVIVRESSLFSIAISFWRLSKINAEIIYGAWVLPAGQYCWNL